MAVKVYKPEYPGLYYFDRVSIYNVHDSKHDSDYTFNVCRRKHNSIANNLTKLTFSN
jgi:hypothetical protein